MYATKELTSNYSEAAIAREYMPFLQLSREGLLRRKKMEHPYLSRAFMPDDYLPFRSRLPTVRRGWWRSCCPLRRCVRDYWRIVVSACVKRKTHLKISTVKVPRPCRTAVGLPTLTHTHTNATISNWHSCMYTAFSSMVQIQYYTLHTLIFFHFKLSACVWLESIFKYYMWKYTRVTFIQIFNDHL